LRPDHAKSVLQWARFVRNNPHVWKAEHTRFINAIFAKHNQAVARIGAEKLRLAFERQQAYRAQCVSGKRPQVVDGTER